MTAAEYKENVGSDIDAEGEEDFDVTYEAADDAEPKNNPENEARYSEPNGELEDGEEEDAEGESDEDEFVGAVKIRQGKGGDDDEDPDVQDTSDVEEASFAEGDSDKADSESSSSASGEEQAWEDASAGGEEAETDIATRNNCVFCGQDEEHDPCEEFEEYLACAVCGMLCNV